MLSRQAVERYLAILDVRTPALAAVARHYFTIDRLTARLREQLRNKIPIKNLPEVLEKFLEEVD